MKEGREDEGEGASSLLVGCTEGGGEFALRGFALGLEAEG